MPDVSQWSPFSADTLVVYGLTGVVLGGTVLFAIARWFAHRRAEARARAAESSLPPLDPGPISLYGIVETDDDTPALTLTLRETGREWKNKAWEYEWKEDSRDLVTHPFTLRLSSGDAVRVLPDERVIYSDALEVRRFEGTQRERVATLVTGELARVDGVLSTRQPGRNEGVYRGGSPSIPLVRAGLTEALRVTVGGRGKSHGHWARWYGVAALALSAAFAVLHLGFLRTYHALTFTGRAIEAEVIRTDVSYRAHEGPGHTRHDATIRYRDVDGAEHTAVVEISPSAYQSSIDGELRTLPLVFMPDDPSLFTVGSRPMLNVPLAFAAVMMSAAMLVMFWLGRERAKPWYEQRRVVESGKGRLTTSMLREKPAIVL
ncbi:hypothetical protein [Chondromyces apiculatus]|uniref:DUF3592 domain-containing protein n=1 Tax=Chondromyces apiculatus DSM 436 TaxID=1192034 RepID=A0A017TBE0_9BACT|nr:hypothetical protein [Chondromyces apiculatus]EYF06135.1 Hypothetical protein CAP_2325 [Chondromyces apiculatus DSM 436]